MGIQPPCWCAACGPTGSMSIYLKGGNFTPGFQCTELAERFLWVAKGWTEPQVPTDGAAVVAWYATTHGLAVVKNGTLGKAPAQGTIMSFSTDPTFPNSNGHVGVVTESSVDPSTGTGSITIVSEDAGAQGGTTLGAAEKTQLLVHGWTVANLGSYGFSEWLDMSTSVSVSPGNPSDFNGDGRSDLVYWYPNGEVDVLGSNANGQLTQFQTTTHVAFPAWAGVGDFNGDGKADLVYWYPNGEVDVLGSNANGQSHTVPDDHPRRVPRLGRGR